jgi:hypothetical protein
MAPVPRAVLRFARIRDRRQEEPRTPGAPVIHSGDQVVQDGRVWALRPPNWVIRSGEARSLWCIPQAAAAPSLRTP